MDYQTVDYRRTIVVCTCIIAVALPISFIGLGVVLGAYFCRALDPNGSKTRALKERDHQAKHAGLQAPESIAGGREAACAVAASPPRSGSSLGVSIRKCADVLARVAVVCALLNGVLSWLTPVLLSRRARADS